MKNYLLSLILAILVHGHFKMKTVLCIIVYAGKDKAVNVTRSLKPLGMTMIQQNQIRIPSFENVNSKNVRNAML